MKILITGGTGFIGRALTTHLRGLGHDVFIISRTPKAAGEFGWEALWPEVDVAIHLAGKSIAEGRWTKAFVKEALESRVETAKTLLKKLTPRCKLIISASGANCYPLNDGTLYDESGKFGDSISGKICEAWEGVFTNNPLPWKPRFVAMRMGFVIGAGDSGVAKMTQIYKAWLGGVVGSGKQRLSWVGLTDLVRMYEYVMSNENISGPVNCVAPTPCSYKDFDRAFAKALKVPAPWWIPGFVMQLFYGKMADELILADYPTVPKKLHDAGFAWQQTDIAEAVKMAVKK